MHHKETGLCCPFKKKVEFYSSKQLSYWWVLLALLGLFFFFIKVDPIQIVFSPRVRLLL